MAEGELDLPSEFLLAAVLAFAPLAFGTTESWSRATLAALLSLLYVLRVNRLGWAGAVCRPLPPLLWAIGALGVMAALQFLHPVYAPAIPLASGPMTVSRTLTVEWLFDWTLYASLLLFLPKMFRTRGSAERLAWLLLLCGAALAVIGIFQQQAGNEYYYGVRKVSQFRVPFGPYPNKNHAGTYLAIAALVGAGLTATLIERYRTLRKDARPDELLGRLTIILALEFLIIFGLFRANSRGAAIAGLGAGGVAAAFYGLRARGAGRATTLGFVLASALLLATVGRQAGVRFSSFIPTVAENSVTFRYAMAADGLRILGSEPWTGIGLGALKAAYPLWMDPVMKSFTTDHLHCDPIELAAEAGLPLAAAYYLAFVVTLGLAAQGGTDGRTPPVPLTLAFCAAPAAFLTHQVLEFPSHIPSLHLTALICLSAAWGASDSGGPADAKAPPRPWIRRATWGGLAGLWLFVLSPRIVAAYLDLLSSRYPHPSKLYYQAAAARWEPTFFRSQRLARAYWSLALDNPAARDILLRKALLQSAAALQFEPAEPDGLRVHAGILNALGRDSDAKALLRPL